MHSDRNSNRMMPARVQVRTPAELGKVIRARRKALGMTQEELALQAGVSVPTIIAAERGKETAQIGAVFGLCRDLGIELLAGP